MRVRLLPAVILAGVLMIGRASPGLAQGLFEDSLSGGEEPADDLEASTGASAPDGVELTGYLRSVLYLGKTPGQDMGQVKSGYGEASFRIKASRQGLGDGIGELRAFHDVVTGEPGFRVREAYVNTYLGPLDLRVGYQIIPWGRADGTNPTDNITPRDNRVFSPDVEDRRLANFAVRAAAFFRPIRLELVWVPVYGASHFPEIPFPSQVVMGAPSEPGLDLDTGTVGTRIHLETDGIEASVSHVFGYNPLPGLELKSLSMAETGPSLLVGFRPYRNHIFGADFSTVLGEFAGLRGEVAWRLPQEDGSPEYEPLSDLWYVVGLDKDLDDVTNVMVQYVGRFVPDWTELKGVGLTGGTPDPAAAMAHPDGLEGAVRDEIRIKNRMINGHLDQVSHQVLARISRQLLHETLELEALGSWNFLTEEWMARVRASYDLADALALTLGGELFQGPDGTMFGAIDQVMSAGFLELKASF